MQIDAIILAGGFGKRLRSQIKDLPKSLAPIHHRPFLDLLLDQLHCFKKVRKVTLAVSYLADQIIAQYEKNDYSFKIDFSIEKQPLGTGGAIKQAISKTETKQLLVLNGDSYTNFDFDLLLKEHLTHQSKMTFCLVQSEETARYGQVKLNPQTKKILAFKEKSETLKSGFINAGVYLIDRDALDQFPENQILSMETEILPQLLLSDLYGFLCEGDFIDIGTKESYLEAQKYLRNRMEQIK